MGGVMVSVLASSVVYRGFEPQSGQPKDYALVVEEAGENHRPWASNWQTLSLAAASRLHPFCNLQNRA
jgi:hypothetical protein